MPENGMNRQTALSPQTWAFPPQALNLVVRHPYSPRRRLSRQIGPSGVGGGSFWNGSQVLWRSGLGWVF